MPGATINWDVRPACASSQRASPVPMLELTDSPRFSTKFKGQELVSQSSGVLTGSGALNSPNLFPLYLSVPPQAP